MKYKKLDRMHDLATRLFPICRSITGDGVRETLCILQEYIPELVLHEVPTGTRFFDWEVPKEWRIREAYIENSQKERIVDFTTNNLHVVGYSLPVDKYCNLEELKKYIYVEESDETVIPYVTS